MMIENGQPYALVFGVSVFDICGFTDRNYRCNDSNPGKVKTSRDCPSPSPAGGLQHI